jgi:MoaA/NifB/PqqE/SkfB family radical SAM enzyme
MGGPGPDPGPGNPRPPGEIRYEPKYEIAVVDITEDCNLNCLHCYNRKRSSRFLSVPQGELIAYKLKMMDMKYVIFSGGEPLVHKEFFRLVDTFNFHRLPVIMRTNAQLINTQLADKIASRDFHFVGVSIDGGTKEINDLIRGEGTFDQAIWAIKLLKERNLSVTIEVTLTSLSIKQVSEIISKAERLGVNMVIFRRFIPLGRGAFNKELCSPDAEVQRARESILTLAEQSFVRLEIGCNLGGICPAYDYVAIDVEGWVHPCYMVRKRLFHIDELDCGLKHHLEPYKGQNVHECLSVL